MDKAFQLLAILIPNANESKDSTAGQWILLALLIPLGFSWLFGKIPGFIDGWGKVSRRRVLSRKALQESIGQSSALYDYLQQLIETESFHVATNIKVPWRTVIALGHLCQHGLLPHNGLKNMANYISPEDDGSIKFINSPGPLPTLRFLLTMHGFPMDLDQYHGFYFSPPSEPGATR
ncbi:hypothetical protein ACNFH5_30110 [Pseudomonas sp. NY15435]|uniref:hypothetical protein n=1 Tax=Pseudomonas sp. NY15435 TaxID=3400358 RepID=UPI003A86D3B0